PPARIAQASLPFPAFRSWLLSPLAGHCALYGWRAGMGARAEGAQTPLRNTLPLFQPFRRAREEPGLSRTRALLFLTGEPMQLEGRTAITPGAGGGLGRQHALYLARKGARVVVNDLGLDAAEAVAAEIRAAGGTAIAAAASVTDEAAVAAMVQRTLQAWG